MAPTDSLIAYVKRSPLVEDIKVVDLVTPEQQRLGGLRVAANYTRYNLEQTEPGGVVPMTGEIVWAVTVYAPTRAEGAAIAEPLGADIMTAGGFSHQGLIIYNTTLESVVPTSSPISPNAWLFSLLLRSEVQFPW